MIDRTAFAERLAVVVLCPRCREPLHRDGQLLRCASGHATDPTAEGYVDASQGVPEDSVTRRTFRSFGYEWTTFDAVEPEDEQFAENYFRDLDLQSLRGKTGLDAGCGKGRYTRFLAPHLGALIALEGSAAVEAAARNLSSLENVFVLKSDLRDAPIRSESLDFVSCLGVLHHLADPEEGFRHLTGLLAPGGRMLVYVYSAPAGRGARSFGLSLAALLRRVTVRMPLRLLRRLSAPIAALLYVGVVAPGRLGEKRRIGSLERLPMATYRGAPLRSLVLDTFDRLSAPVEHRYRWSDLEPWFSHAGLVVESARDEAGWFVVARRPDRDEPAARSTGRQVRSSA